MLGPQLAEYQQIAGRENGSGDDFTGGGINYLDKDLRTLTGAQFRRPYRTKFCGLGNAETCRATLWRVLDEAGAALAQRQANESADAWRADANAERIGFAPGLLQTTIRYTNRPSGIQQVVSFGGHRPRSRR